MNQPVTDTGTSALSLACSLPDNTDEAKENNAILMDVIVNRNDCPNINFKD